MFVLCYGSLNVNLYFVMIALVTTSEETSWIRCLLTEIPLWEKLLSVVLVHCDSTATIAKIKNRYYNGKRQHINRKHNMIREKS
jgi:hypothetical protein